MVVYFKGGFSVRKGQSLIEYLILFAILAGLSLVLAQRVPSIFNAYVINATANIK